MASIRLIIKRQLFREDYFVIAANLLPVYGVCFLGWKATEVFIVYALETLIVGFITLLRLGIVTAYRKKDTWHNAGSSSTVSGLFFMFFFVMHFGIFVAVQTGIFSMVAGITPPGSGSLHFLFHWYEYINREIGWMLAVFFISYLVKSVVPFIVNEEYKTQSMMRIMFQPYGRIFIQQFTVILGSMFLVFGLGIVFVFIFAAAKIFFEVFIDFAGIINKSMDDLEKEKENGL